MSSQLPWEEKELCEQPLQFKEQQPCEHPITVRGVATARAPHPHLRSSICTCSLPSTARGAIPAVSSAHQRSHHKMRISCCHNCPMSSCHLMSHCCPRSNPCMTENLDPKVREKLGRQNNLKEKKRKNWQKGS